MDGIIIYIQKQVEGGFVNEFKNILPDQVYTVVGILLQVVALYLTAWILYKGIRILLGKDNENVKDFAWDAFLKGIFIAFCVNGGDWINLVNGAMEGIRSVAFSDGLNLYNSLQEFYNNTYNITEAIINEMSWRSPGKSFLSVFVMIFCWIGFAMGALSLLFTLILNTLSFYLLILVSPLIFFFLIFGFLKGVFTQWYTLLLSNILTLFFLFLFCGGALVFVNKMAVTTLAAFHKNNSLLLIAMNFIFCGLIVLVFTNLAKTISEKLTNVSVEASVGSVARDAMGTSGSLAGLGVRAGLSGVRSAARTAGYAANFGKNWKNAGFKQALKRDGASAAANYKTMYNKYIKGL